VEPSESITYCHSFTVSQSHSFVFLDLGRILDLALNFRAANCS
jgi:hypothetical protein